jgi:hypothetical protein
MTKDKKTPASLMRIKGMFGAFPVSQNVALLLANASGIEIVKKG